MKVTLSRNRRPCEARDERRGRWRRARARQPHRPQFLNAGPASGAPLPKDTFALLETGREYRRPLRLIETTVAINGRARSHEPQGVAAVVAASRARRLPSSGSPSQGQYRRHARVVFADHHPRAAGGGGKGRAFDPQGMENAAALLPGWSSPRQLCGGGRRRGGGIVTNGTSSAPSISIGCATRWPARSSSTCAIFMSAMPSRPRAWCTRASAGRGACPRPDAGEARRFWRRPSFR